MPNELFSNEMMSDSASSLSIAQCAALGTVVAAAEDGRKFALLTGPAGAGKTAVFDMAASLLGRPPIRVIRVHADGEALTLPRLVFQIAGAGPDDDPAEVIEQALDLMLMTSAPITRTILMVDDAHALQEDALTYLQLTSGLQDRDKPSLQVMFAGHAEFWSLLEPGHLRSLREQVTFCATLEGPGPEVARTGPEFATASAQEASVSQAPVLEAPVLEAPVLEAPVRKAWGDPPMLPQSHGRWRMTRYGVAAGMAVTVLVATMSPVARDEDFVPITITTLASDDDPAPAGPTRLASVQVASDSALPAVQLSGAVISPAMAMPMSRSDRPSVLAAADPAPDPVAGDLGVEILTADAEPGAIASVDAPTLDLSTPAPAEFVSPSPTDLLTPIDLVVTTPSSAAIVVATDQPGSATTPVPDDAPATPAFSSVADVATAAPRQAAGPERSEPTEAASDSPPSTAKSDSPAIPLDEPAASTEQPDQAMTQADASPPPAAPENAPSNAETAATGDPLSPDASSATEPPTASSAERSDQPGPAPTEAIDNAPAVPTPNVAEGPTTPPPPASPSPAPVEPGATVETSSSPPQAHAGAAAASPDQPAPTTSPAGDSEPAKPATAPTTIAAPAAPVPAAVTPATALAVPSAAPVRQTPTAAAQPTAALPPALIASLISRGNGMLRLGDIAAARLAYKRAAEAGSGEAAVAMGKTYDPRFLAQAGARSVPPDPAGAADWYRQAIALGNRDASALLAGLDGNGATTVKVEQ